MLWRHPGACSSAKGLRGPPAHGKRMGCNERTLSRIHSEEPPDSAFFLLDFSALPCLPGRHRDPTFWFLLSVFLRAFSLSVFSISAFRCGPHDAHSSSSNLRSDPFLGPGARVHLGGPRQCLRVDILPDVRQFAISNGNGEDKMVLERPIRGFDFPPSEADDQNPVSLRYEFGGLWVDRKSVVDGIAV